MPVFARQRRRRIPRRRFYFDQLESRRLLCGDNCYELELLSAFDTFGVQIGTVMAYRLPGETDDQARVTSGIYDTGASVVTFSASDQLLFDFGGIALPIKVPGGAAAEAIGGTAVGDVSQPGEIIAAGSSAMTVLIDDDFNIVYQIDLSSGAARTPGVQAFVGTEEGSPILPTITGTVVHNPSPTHPNGNAAWIDMTGYSFDLGELFPEEPEFAGLVIEMPDIKFVEPGTPLIIPLDGTVSPAMRIPLDLWGENNHGNPGNTITNSPNPVQSGAVLGNDGIVSPGHTMLFDTGAQLSIISTDLAIELGLNLDVPETTLTVQGAAGTVDIPGYTIDTLDLPRDDNGDGTIDGTLRFKSVPIFVLDIVDGLDGILGMNLFNLAQDIMYDPFDPAGPSLKLSYFTDVTRELPDPEEEGLIETLAQFMPQFANLVGGNRIPGFDVNTPPTTTLRVTAFSATDTGFVATFNRPLTTAELNLYDQGGLLGPADVTMTGAASGNIRGSLAISSTGNQVTFVKTGAALANDTYTITLRSAANGFHDGVDLLDGNADGTAGDNYVNTFTRNVTPVITATIPDLVRGHGQAANAWNSAAIAAFDGIPVLLNTGVGVRAATFTVNYNPALLTIDTVTLGAGVAADTSLSFAIPTPGTINISLSSFSSDFAAAAGQLTLVNLKQTSGAPRVPSNAPYGARHVLDISNLVVQSASGATLVSAANDGMHVAAYPGDLSGNQSYNSPDASFVQQLVLYPNTFGLAAYSLVDPMILADINANGAVQANDVSQVQRLILNESVPFVPSRPNEAPTAPAQSAAGENHDAAFQALWSFWGSPAQPSAHDSAFDDAETDWYMDYVAANE